MVRVLRFILPPLFFWLVLSSCASHKDYIFEESDESEDLVTAFDLSDPRFERFRIGGDQQQSSEEAIDEEVKDERGESSGPEEKKEPAQEKPIASGEQDKDSEAEKKEEQEKKVVKKSEDGEAGADESDESDEEDEYPEEFYEYDERSAKVWSLFEPNSYTNERFIFRISYLGLTAGTVQLTTEPMTKIGDRHVFHFRAHMKSARYYRFIYELDDRLETFVDAKTFLPVKYSLIQRESGQDVDDLQFFDSEARESHLFFKRVREDRVSEREEVHHIPYYVQDSFSSLYFVRGLPLETGDRYEFPVVTRGSIWMIELEVEGVEEVRVDGEWMEAIRVNAVTRFPGVLEKRGDIVFWYSTDDVRRPLMFQADVRIGSIRGEVIDYTPGRRIQKIRDE